MPAATAKKPASKKAEAPTRSRHPRGKWPYRFELVDVERLSVDHDYQRPLTTFVEKIASHYDPALVGCLIVSERPDGSLTIIDGQTRWEAMRRNLEPGAPCLVYMGLTREQEAQLFSDLQTQRRGMTSYLRFRASLVARNPEAVAITELVNAAGFELGIVEARTTIQSVGALETLYRRDPELLTQTLEIIAGAWPDPTTRYRTSAEMLRGIAMFLGRERNVNTERLIEQLSGVAPSMLRLRANSLREGSGSGSNSPGYMADAILAVYMSRKRRG